MTDKPTSDWYTRFLLSPRWHIYRHILLQVAVLCITLNSFWDVPDHLILTWDRFWGWLGYFLILDMAIYANIYILTPRFLVKNKSENDFGHLYDGLYGIRPRQLRGRRPRLPGQAD